MNIVSVFDENVEEYDRWYDENKRAYQAELQAVRRFIPEAGRGLEVGVGTGRFAAPLGIDVGVDPAGNMLARARERGVETEVAYGEDLPFDDESFDYVLMATLDPFVDDLEAVLREARRVLKRRGTLIVAMLDRDSPFGRIRETVQDEDKFYAQADFHAAGEMIARMRGVGFDEIRTAQTLLGEEVLPLVEREGYGAEVTNDAFEIHEGYGEGAFVVISGKKKLAVQVD